MPFVKIWIHAVWATKKRRPLLPSHIRPIVFDHMHENALNKDILMDIVGGHEDHVHCLFRLKNEQTISKTIQLIKGESSFWINQQKLIPTKFEWQTEYYAVSVSESVVENVRRYIQNQEEHHRKKNFLSEFEEFVKRYGFGVFGD